MISTGLQLLQRRLVDKQRLLLLVEQICYGVGGQGPRESALREYVVDAGDGREAVAVDGLLGAARDGLEDVLHAGLEA